MYYAWGVQWHCQRGSGRKQGKGYGHDEDASNCTVESGRGVLRGVCLLATYGRVAAYLLGRIGGDGSEPRTVYVPRL